MGSTRLPGKVLKPIARRPMLAFMLERLRTADAGPLVLATSDDARDNPVAALGRECAVPVVRGSEADVLSRFVLALDAFPSECVVRLTADSPLADPDVITDALALHARLGVAYTSNSLLRTFPDGLDVEVVDVSALREADACATRADEREHVTPYLQRHPDRFPIAQLDSGSDLGHLRWTVDERDDLERLRALVSRVDAPVRAPWRAFLDASPPEPRPELSPARAEDPLPDAPPAIIDAARDWWGGRDRPFARVYTDHRGAWIALDIVDGRAHVSVHPERARARLVTAALALTHGDRQIVELLETPA
jgi:spore coat polysaccharide biosynthesis protein SpsF